MEENPDLADNIIAGLPEAKDLLPPHLLARIPPVEDPVFEDPTPQNIPTPPPSISSETPKIACSQLSSIIGSHVRRSSTRGSSKRHQRPLQKFVFPDVVLQPSQASANGQQPVCRPLADLPEDVQIWFPVKPKLLHKPEKPSSSRQIRRSHLSPPPLTPGYASFGRFTRFPSSPSLSKHPKPLLLRKACSVDNIKVSSDGFGTKGTLAASSADYVESQFDLLSAVSIESLSTLFADDEPMDLR